MLRAKRDPAEVGKCAGYTVDTLELGNCMSGKACLPALSTDGYASVLEHATVRNGRQLLETSLPRLTNASMLLSQYEAAADECKKKPREQAAICMSRGGLKPTDQKTFDCATAVAAKKGGMKDTSKCLLDAIPDGPDKELAKCATGDLSDHKTMALCVTLPNAPPAVKAGVACMEQFMKMRKNQAAFDCVKDNPLVSADLAKAAECMNKYPNEWTAAAVCFEAGKSLPEGSDEAVKCASAVDDYKKFAGCMVTSRLFGNSVGGDGGRLINCAAQSGGDGLGTMACMAGSSLTPEQQIALQCAAQSPDLISFAGCTGGQLSLREFLKCQGHEFGDEVCFGPNNEIRKFLKAVGIDVRKETVLGQIGDANLNVLKAQVAFAEAAGKEIGKVGEAVFHAAEAIGQTASSVLNGLVNAGNSVVDGVKNLFGI